MITPARKTMELMKMMKLATPNRKTSKKKTTARAAMTLTFTAVTSYSPTWTDTSNRGWT